MIRNFACVAEARATYSAIGFFRDTDRSIDRQTTWMRRGNDYVRIQHLGLLDVVATEFVGAGNGFCETNHYFN